MKNALVLILLLFPTLLFAQQSKTGNKSTIKLKRINPSKWIWVPTFNGVYVDDTVTRTELLSIGKLQVISNTGDSARVLGFTLDISVNGEFDEIISPNAYFTSGMISRILQIPNEGIIFIYNVRSYLPSGEMRVLPGFMLKVDSVHRRKINKQKKPPSCVAALRNDWRNISMKVDTLAAIGKLSVMGDYSDSSKIIGFTLTSTTNNITTSYTSTNEYFNSKMLAFIKSATIGTEIKLQNIRYKTPDGATKLLNNLTVKID